MRARIGLLIMMMCLASGQAGAAWDAGDASLELDSARTLPSSHVALHVLRESHVATTDRIELSSHLLMDLYGSPNFKLTWSVFQRPWIAAAFELGTGIRSGLLEQGALPLTRGDQIARGYFLAGGLGTLTVAQRGRLTATVRYTYQGRGVAYGDALSSRGHHQVSPGLNFVLNLGARDMIMLEAQAWPIEELWSFGFPTPGRRALAAAWYGHAFRHLRVMVGAATSSTFPMPDTLRGWPVMPAIELWWDFIPG